jgi:hypothetical protein
MTFGGRVEAAMTVPAGVTLSATNGAGGPTSFGITAGTYYPSTLVTQIQTQLNAARPSGWTVTLSTGASGTSRVTINCSSTPFSITWTDTNLRDALGFAGNIAGVSTAQTGTAGARGLWLPDCPVTLDGDPGRAPLVTDLRTTASPTGAMLGFVGNTFYRHSQIRWTHVAKSRVFESQAVVSKTTWEWFMRETQFGLGLSWFGPLSAVNLYDLSDAAFGVDYVTGGWKMVGVDRIEPRLSVAGWTQLYTIEIPSIISAG